VAEADEGVTISTVDAVGSLMIDPGWEFIDVNPAPGQRLPYN
jgi:hypothetical protein